MQQEKSPQERIRFQRQLLLGALLGQVIALPLFGFVFVRQYFLPPEGFMPGQELFWLKPLLGLVIGLTVLSGAVTMKILLARQESEGEPRAALDTPMGVYAFVTVFLPLLSLFVAESRPGWYFGVLIFTIPLYATVPLAVFYRRTGSFSVKPDVEK